MHKVFFVICLINPAEVKQTWKLWANLTGMLLHNKTKYNPIRVHNFSYIVLLPILYGCTAKIKVTIGMGSANERRRYIVTSSLIGWVHTQNDDWIRTYQLCQSQTLLGMSDAVLSDDFVRWWIIYHVNALGDSVCVTREYEYGYEIVRYGRYGSEFLKTHHTAQ